MYIYFIPLLFLFLLSKYKISKRNVIFTTLVIMFFLCFGYMTGSDWRSYETDYYSGFINRLVEPGYMLLSNLFSSIKINFWIFHIFFKCLSYISISFLIIKLVDGLNPFYPFALWYASFGLYMFIDCPFRNLIACGIGAYSFILLSKNKIIAYYLSCILAMTFHLSSIILLFVPFLDFNKFRTKTLVLIYISLLIILGFGGTDLLLKIINSSLPPVIANRIDYYSESSGSVFSIGLVLRLICLYLITRYRNAIVNNHYYGKLVFSTTYLYLLSSLVYYVFPMLFRSALFLGPFYVVAIFWGIREFKKKYRKILYSLITCAFILIVYTTVKSVYFVPYTNIIPYVIKGETYNYDYRDNYNFINSPYKKKLTD